MEASDLYISSVSRLALLFHDRTEALGTFAQVHPGDLPEAEQTLLAHNNHMTVTLEAFHNSLVDVQVLDQNQEDAAYAREILLSRRSDGGVVQYGIMRIWLDQLPTEAREEIVKQDLPLGRILIRHNVLREVELMTLWKIEPSPYLTQQLELKDAHYVYGRSAQILLDERPTVQLLEIVTS